MKTPLVSWNDGAVKSAILDFVRRTTTEGGPEYVRPSERIATFDNDGTLWCEQPLPVQIFFAFDRLKSSPRRTRDERAPTVQGVPRSRHDDDSEFSKQAALEVAFRTHAGVTEEEFDHVARAWLASAKHPKLGRLFTQCVYRPQLELLEYLRVNGFKTFIVSGGGIDLIRGFAEEVYGIPPEQVIGSSVKTRLEVQGSRIDLFKLSDLLSFGDREAKAQNIGLHIGRRPILAFGNSDGDLAMLRYTKSGSGPCLALLLHHDDKEREYAYDRDFKLSPLVEALDRADEYDITLVSMKRTWQTIFPDT